MRRCLYPRVTGFVNSATALEHVLPRSGGPATPSNKSTLGQRCGFVPVLELGPKTPAFRGPGLTGCSVLLGCVGFVGPWGVCHAGAPATNIVQAACFLGKLGDAADEHDRNTPR